MYRPKNAGVDLVTSIIKTLTKSFVLLLKRFKMKRMLILFFAISLMSCKKEHQKCYHCTFGIYNGQNPPPIDYCGDDGGTRQFKDAQGNDLSSYCQEIH